MYNDQQQQQNAASSKLLRAFVTGYSPHKFTLEELHSELISRYPYISDVVMPQNNKHWKGYAFVDFDIRPDFLSFIREKRIRLQRLEMNLVIKAHKEGKVLQKFIKDVNKRKVCVDHIPSNWDDIKLEEFFLRYGKVENAYVERKLGQVQDHLKGMVIFCAKRCAVECSSLQKIEVAPGVEVKVSLFLQKKGTKDSIGLENRQGKNMRPIGHKQREALSPRIAHQHLNNREHGENRLEIIRGEQEADRRPKRFESEDNFHSYKPTSKNYFRASYLDFKAHVCQFDNICFNVSRRRKNRVWY